jgi:hypothetical protein
LQLSSLLSVKKCLQLKIIDAAGGADPNLLFFYSARAGFCGRDRPRSIFHPTRKEGAMAHGTFCAVVNCMDGRTQLPVIEYLKQRFNTDFVDSVTEPGPNLIVAERTPPHLFDSIIARLRISTGRHRSKAIALVGHHDCAGNPSNYRSQLAQLSKGIAVLKAEFPDAEIVALWVDEAWAVHEV